MLHLSRRAKLSDDGCWTVSQWPFPWRYYVRGRVCKIASCWNTEEWHLRISPWMIRTRWHMKGIITCSSILSWSNRTEFHSSDLVSCLSDTWHMFSSGNEDLLEPCYSNHLNIFASWKALTPNIRLRIKKQINKNLCSISNRITSANCHLIFAKLSTSSDVCIRVSPVVLIPSDSRAKFGLRFTSL